MNLSEDHSVKLDLGQLILVEVRLANQKKSLETTFLLWILLGFFGAHDFYFHRVRYAILKIVLLVLGTSFYISMLSWPSVVEVVFESVYLRMIALGTLFIWWVSDGFRLNHWIQKDTDKTHQEIIHTIDLEMQ